MPNDKLNKWIQSFISRHYNRFGQISSKQKELLPMTTPSKLKANYLKNKENSLLAYWIEDSFSLDRFKILMEEEIISDIRLHDFEYVREDLVRHLFLLEWKKRIDKFSR